MSLPPVWYWLLLVTTAAAAPWILRRATTWRSRRWAGALLAGLLLYDVGLILLFYSKFACWLLVATGLAVWGTQALPRRPLWGAAAAFVPAAAAGVMFQMLPEPQGFFVYFGLALPLLIVSVMVALLGQVSRDRLTTPWLLAAASLVLFGALTPASAFAFTFLYHYEVFHLPVLVAALVGLAVLLRGMDEGARAVATTIGDRLASPPRGDLRAAALLFGAAMVVVAVPFVEAPFSPGWATFAWTGLAAVALTGLWLAVSRTQGVAAAGAALAAAVMAAVGVTAALRFGAEAFQGFGGGPAPESLLFYAAGSALTLLGLGAVLAMARIVDAANRSRLATQPDRLVRAAPWSAADAPRGFAVENIPTLPTPAELSRLRARLTRSRGAGAIVVVEQPRDDLLDPLPEALHGWLAAQGPGPKVHVAVKEGLEVFLVPWLDPEEEG